ncbi:MAG: magnesium transporter, partial [Acidobacteriota bacterium]|nr:magnesium transporter [Acidobacteriota bacterium]
YLQVSFWELVRKRGGWLIALFLGQLLTLNAMEMFRDRLKFTVMMFVPLIISSGGNSGSQAATLVVRAMALEEVKLSDWFRVFRRELLFGMTLGVILAGIGFLRTFLDRFLGVALGSEWDTIGFAVGISLICVVMWGVLVGSMLPFVMQWLGVDPATSSTPFVATIVDVTGLLIYFLVCTALITGG